MIIIFLRRLIDNAKSVLIAGFLVVAVFVLAFTVKAGYAKTDARPVSDRGPVAKLDIITPAASVEAEIALSNRTADNKPFADSASSDRWQTVQMRVTAYCPCSRCCGEYSDGITASGYRIRPGDTFVAADKEYPFGTEMIIPGYSSSRVVKVLDRGGAITGGRLDVFFGSHEEALEWGVRNLNVKVRLN